MGSCCCPTMLPPFLTSATMRAKSRTTLEGISSHIKLFVYTSAAVPCFSALIDASVSASGFLLTPGTGVIIESWVSEEKRSFPEVMVLYWSALSWKS